MIKKILSYAVAMVMAVGMVSTTAFAAGNRAITPSSVEAAAGETVTVDVKLTNNDAGTALGGFFINYDPKLTYNEAASAAGSAFANTSLQLMEAGSVYCSFATANGRDFSGDAVICTLSFTLPADASGSYAVTVVEDTDPVFGGVLNFNGEFLTVDYNAASITVPGATTVAKYFAASFTPGVKSAANNAIKFFFEDGTEKGDTTVYYGDVSIENLESVVTAVEVTEVPKDSALKLVDTAWTTIVK